MDEAKNGAKEFSIERALIIEILLVPIAMLSVTAVVGVLLAHIR